jgi:hypothetical protein
MLEPLKVVGLEHEEKINHELEPNLSRVLS